MRLRNTKQMSCGFYRGQITLVSKRQDDILVPQLMIERVPEEAIGVRRILMPRLRQLSPEGYHLRMGGNIRRTENEHHLLIPTETYSPVKEQSRG